MTILARPYRDERDLEAMRRLLMAAGADAHRAGYLHVGDVVWRVWYTLRAYDPRSVVSVWEAEGEDLIGFALFYPMYAGFNLQVHPANRVGEFEPVATRPGFRRRGLARAIMLEGLRRMKAHGAGDVRGEQRPGQALVRVGRLPRALDDVRLHERRVGTRPGRQRTERPRIGGACGEGMGPSMSMEGSADGEAFVLYVKPLRKALPVPEAQVRARRGDGQHLQVHKMMDSARALPGAWLLAGVLAFLLAGLQSHGRVLLEGEDIAEESQGREL